MHHRFHARSRRPHRWTSRSAKSGCRRRRRRRRPIARRLVSRFVALNGRHGRRQTRRRRRRRHLRRDQSRRRRSNAERDENSFAAVETAVAVGVGGTRAAATASRQRAVVALRMTTTTRRAVGVMSADTARGNARAVLYELGAFLTDAGKLQPQVAALETAVLTMSTRLNKANISASRFTKTGQFLQERFVASRL